MFVEGVKTTLVLVCFCSVGLCCGCTASPSTSPGNATTTGAVVEAGKKVPVTYVCSGCGAKIERDSVGTGGFIAKCPHCGKQFLTL